MAAQTLAGAAASPGLAAGSVRLLGAVVETAQVPPGAEDEELARARAALAATADRLAELAAAAHGEEAEILETSVLMARDPSLAAGVEAEIRERRRPAGAALLAAGEAVAATLAAIDDPMLAARADDVRSIARRAAAIAAGEADERAAGSGPIVLVASDLGPADVAELDHDVCAIALAAGAVTAHAAIVARARGLPMVVATGAAALAAAPGAEAVVDGNTGRLLLTPTDAELETARDAMAAREREQRQSLTDRALAAVTRDGHRLLVLTNAASAAEVRTGLEAGAEGAGLVRTELAFLDAPRWPTEDEHRRALEPVLGPLRGRVATVRVLDFGGDKTPPFLDGTRDRGLRLLLGHTGAFSAQARAILRAAEGCELRILLPMVSSGVELVATRALIERAAAQVGAGRRLQLGAMIETPRAAGVAFQLAGLADFLSIGTNDLTHATLGSDRFSAAEAATHHPKVLRAIDRSVRAARSAGIPLEVCGEAASDPLVLPLLVGLGVDELSVGAARVGATRAWVRSLDRAACADIAARALEAVTAADVEQLATPLRPDRVSVAG